MSSEREYKFIKFPINNLSTITVNSDVHLLERFKNYMHRSIHGFLHRIHEFTLLLAYKV